MREAVPPLVRLAAGAGLVAPPLAAVALATAGAQSPGYDPLVRTISRLGEQGAPHAPAINLVLAALGVALVAVAWALGRTARDATAACGVLGVAGAALVGVAAVSRDPAHPAVTVAHRALALVFFGALTLAPLVLGRTFRRRPGWRRLAVASLGVGVVSAALLASAVALIALGRLLPGAWERAVTGLDMLWFTALAARLVTWRDADATEPRTGLLPVRGSLAGSLQDAPAAVEATAAPETGPGHQTQDGEQDDRADECDEDLAEYGRR